MKMNEIRKPGKISYADARVDDAISHLRDATKISRFALTHGREVESSHRAKLALEKLAEIDRLITELEEL